MSETVNTYAELRRFGESLDCDTPHWVSFEILHALAALDASRAEVERRERQIDRLREWASFNGTLSGAQRAQIDRIIGFPGVVEAEEISVEEITERDFETLSRIANDPESPNGRLKVSTRRIPLRQRHGEPVTLDPSPVCQWTNEIPTVQGWYWYKTPLMKDAVIDWFFVGVGAMQGYWFYGPITPPPCPAGNAKRGTP